MQVTMIGLDIAKNVFQVHGVDAEGRVAVRKKLRRSAVLRFFAELAPCLVGLEACAGAHHWARQLGKLGHEVRLLPPAYVKPYVKRGKKNDAVDAEAICEALGRPSMRFVPVKSAGQQAILVQHRTRDLLVRQRTMQINALRAHLAEFGIVAAKGGGGLTALLERLHGADEAALPVPARQALMEMAAAIGALERRIARLGAALVKANKADPVARRLMTIPGIGPITASALSAMVGDPAVFACGRHFAAWLGLVPSQHGTGGKLRLGAITKRGDRYLRRLLVLGATSLLRRTGHAGDPLCAWLARLVAAGKPARLASVALANKLARIAWAVMARAEPYRPKAVVA